MNRFTEKLRKCRPMNSYVNDAWHTKFNNSTTTVSVVSLAKFNTQPVNCERQQASQTTPPPPPWVTECIAEAVVQLNQVELKSQSGQNCWKRGLVCTRSDEWSIEKNKFGLQLVQEIDSITATQLTCYLMQHSTIHQLPHWFLQATKTTWPSVVSELVKKKVQTAYWATKLCWKG